MVGPPGLGPGRPGSRIPRLNTRPSIANRPVQAICHRTICRTLTFAARRLFRCGPSSQATRLSLVVLLRSPTGLYVARSFLALVRAVTVELRRKTTCWQRSQKGPGKYKYKCYYILHYRASVPRQSYRRDGSSKQRLISTEISALEIINVLFMSLAATRVEIGK